jgi:hypothetical protein
VTAVDRVCRLRARSASPALPSVIGLLRPDDSRPVGAGQVSLAHSLLGERSETAARLPAASRPCCPVVNTIIRSCRKVKCERKAPSSPTHRPRTHWRTLYWPPLRPRPPIRCRCCMPSWSPSSRTSAARVFVAAGSSTPRPNIQTPKVLCDKRFTLTVRGSTRAPDRTDKCRRPRCRTAVLTHQRCGCGVLRCHSRVFADARYDVRDSLALRSARPAGPPESGVARRRRATPQRRGQSRVRQAR